VFVGTLFPLLFEALHKTISIGPPYFNLTFAPLMAGALLVLPAGPLLAWKRADLKGVWQRLILAALLGVGAAVFTLVLHAPLAAFASIGVGLGVWVATGALVEAAQRVRLFKAPLAESLRRIGGLPRGSWGMTLAHLGLGLFVMGAAYETAYRVEASEVLAPGGSLRLGAYVLTLESVAGVAGPNYEAERARIAVTRANGAPVCKTEPERRYYPANRQQTSEVGLCFKGLSDLYVVAGDARPLPGGGEGRLVRAYWNPWVRLIFLGPLLMAVGGALSLSDRRLRLAAGKRVQPAAAEARA
jgi:cytochrome c-type biogenesis protein CcmF